MPFCVVVLCEFMIPNICGFTPLQSNLKNNSVLMVSEKYEKHTDVSRGKAVVLECDVYFFISPE